MIPQPRTDKAFDEKVDGRRLLFLFSFPERLYPSVPNRTNQLLRPHKNNMSRPITRTIAASNSASTASANSQNNHGAKKSLWSDLPRRLATICIGFPLVWTMLSRPMLSRIFFMGAHGLSLWEFTMLEPASFPTSGSTNGATLAARPTTVSRLLYCTLSVLLATVTARNDPLLQLLLCCMAGILVWLERRHWILGMIVVTLPFRVWIGLAPRDFASTISVLLVVWNCDTGALLVGRISSKLGFPRLPVPEWIRRISPAKSMEGFLGGILGGTWTAVSWIPLLIRWASIETSPEFDVLWGSSFNRLGLGFSLSLLAIIGDLVESSIKRQSQSKDSGSILPGHGGILDRFDSSLLAVLLYQLLLENW